MATAKEKKEEVKASLKILRAELRKMHISGKFPANHKCSKQCDQIKLHEHLK